MFLQDETTTAILRNRREGGKNKQWDIWLWIINVPVIFVLVLVIEVYFVLLNFNLELKRKNYFFNIKLNIIS